MNINADLTNAVLETDRLILRKWREADLNDLHEYASVEGVGEMAGWNRHESLEHSQKILQLFLTDASVLAIELKENSKVIGSIGLHESWATPESEYAALKIKELGYALSKTYWGKGIVPEAAKAMIKFCFERLGLDALTCSHFASNNQSRRVIEKSGFTFVKSGSWYSVQMQQAFDTLQYILFKPNLQQD